MSIYLYDQAVTKKFKSWTEETDVHVYSPSDTRRLFEVMADTTNDSPIELPIICIRRNPTYTLSEPSRKPLSYDGLTPDASYERSLQINAIPVTISYQVDIYTRYLQEADEYVRNIVFNIVNFPSFRVELPYLDEGIEHDSSLTLSSEVEDNSSVPERLISGQFTRYTLNISVEDAYLWDIRVRDNYHITGDTIEFVNTDD